MNRGTEPGGHRRPGTGLGGIPLGTFAQIPVHLDWSAAIIIWLLTWGLAVNALPALAPGYGDALYWLAGSATALIFLASLLAHELSHSVTAQRRGLVVRDVTLWALGGMAILEGEPASPRDDLAIAVAGPAASAAVAGAAFVVAAVAAALGAPELVVAMLVWLASINAVLALFNLAPAAPLDGGRILRAVLWRRRGDRTSAAVSAARAGQVFGRLLIGLGLFELLIGLGVGGLWLIILGWFVITAARAEQQQVELSDRLAGLMVSDVMSSHPVVAPASLTVDRVLESFVLRHRCSAFPLVDRHGDVVGLVTLTRLKDVTPERRASTTVREVAWPVEAVPRARPTDALLDVLRHAGTGGDGRILVFDDGDLVGIVSPTDIARAVAARPGGRGTTNVERDVGQR